MHAAAHAIVRLPCKPPRKNAACRCSLPSPSPSLPPPSRSQGHELYYGQAAAAADWFAGLGYPLPFGVSLADFILDLASADVATEHRWGRCLGRLAGQSGGWRASWRGKRQCGGAWRCSAGAHQAHANPGVHARLPAMSMPHGVVPRCCPPGRATLPLPVLRDGEASRTYLVEQAEAFLARHPQDGYCCCAAQREVGMAGGGCPGEAWGGRMRGGHGMPAMPARGCLHASLLMLHMRRLPRRPSRLSRSSQMLLCGWAARAAARPTLAAQCWWGRRRWARRQWAWME